MQEEIHLTYNASFFGLGAWNTASQFDYMLVLPLVFAPRNIPNYVYAVPDGDSVLRISADDQRHMRAWSMRMLTHKPELHIYVPPKIY